MTIPIGWILVCGFIFTSINISLFNEDLLFPTFKTLILRVIVGFLSIFTLLLFVQRIDNYFIYSTSPIIDRREKIDSSITKITSLQIIEERERNWFTGKWGDESTASFEENVIKIDYVNSQNKSITTDDKPITKYKVGSED